MSVVLPPPPSGWRPAVRSAPQVPARPGLREHRGRNGEILTRTNRGEPGDQYDIPLHLIEKGWNYQWVRTECLAKPDPKNVTVHHENGWRPVMAERMPGHFHPVDYCGPIVREGLMLMERPQSMTDEAERDNYNRAKRQRHNQSAEFQGVDKLLDEVGATQHAFAPSSATTDSRNWARPKLNKTIEGVPTSLYPHREYSTGDDD